MFCSTFYCLQTCNLQSRKMSKYEKAKALTTKGLASNRYTGGLRFSILAHIRKLTVCHGRAELDFSITQKLIYMHRFFNVFNVFNAKILRGTLYEWRRCYILTRSHPFTLSWLPGLCPPIGIELWRPYKLASYHEWTLPSEIWSNRGSAIQ